ncbi:GGDEF domain-containing protein [Geoalkalibacter sp.]|uniref:GGDEF domain-containing protein n=1 Tax=Geoalkalibacter sp. TaxID=3041440 RepID=UPI00272DD81C|nr:diguanylate cyclase [Geoalkalibacter sp.]
MSMNAPAVIFAHRHADLEALTGLAAGVGLFDAFLPCSGERQLFDLLEHREPAMILFACAAEQVDALLWLKILGKRDRWKDIPVTVFAGDDQLDARVAALELGACEVLSLATPLREISARLHRRMKQRQEMIRLKKSREDLARVALTDSLTGLCNRAFFDVTLESEAARSARTGLPYSLLMIDVDHFKWVNDTYGHQLGDTVLQGIARVLKRSVRKSDMACRYGGEEFALILPETDIPAAQVLAVRIHREIAVLAASYDHFRHPLTVSIGISCGSGKEQADPALLIEKADCALYAAKRNGRNRTEIFNLGKMDFSPAEARDLRPPSNLRM